MTEVLISPQDKQAQYESDDESDHEKETEKLQEDMFADQDEIRGEPVKGKRYMWFSIFCMIILSALVLNDAKHMSLHSLAKKSIEH